MAAPMSTPLPPSLERTLAEELRTGQWTATTRQFFLELLLKLQELESRIEALEP